MFSAVGRDPPLRDKLEEILKKPPFNSGFGIYVYLVREDARDFYFNAEKIFNDILKIGLRDYDVYKITENVSEQEMMGINNELGKIN
jgi:hypothetical protein